MTLQSAGLLLYRAGALADLEVLLVHPGGPFWSKKDVGAWSIPKGEYLSGEDPLRAAEREFQEELGSPPPTSDRLNLGEIRQPGGKRVTVWASEGDFDVDGTASNTFEVELPRGSGRFVSFPEVDRAAWMPLAEAEMKILKGQRGFLDRLVSALGPVQ